LAEAPQSVTSLGVSPEEERRGRVLKYSLAMGIRLVCIVFAVTLHGWLMWIGFIGAIFLPYFAVVIANATGTGVTKKSTLVTTPVAPTLSISADAFINASASRSEDGKL
jgi:hypothetical protein